MSAKTGIEWTDSTWNPIRGCSLVSEGCRNCYAMGVAARFSGPGQAYEGLARRRSNGEPQWTGEVSVVDRHMLDPLKWKEPRRIFVNSMSDLFHERVSITTIAEVFAVMGLAHQHTHQVLTKRPERMQAVLTSEEFLDEMNAFIETIAFERSDSLNRRTDDLRATAPDIHGDDWPLKNVWLGVSVENQGAADERIPLLLQTPAAVRFLSCEPLLGPVELSIYLEEEGYIDDQYVRPIDWVIVGGESGPHARPMHPDWATHLAAECEEHNVPFFFKQWGEWSPTGPLMAKQACVDRAGRTVYDHAEFPRGATSADGWQIMYRIGKKNAGRELLNRTWDQFPQAVAP